MAEIDTLRCYHALHARRPPHPQMKWIFLEAVVVESVVLLLFGGRIDRSYFC